MAIPVRGPKGLAVSRRAILALPWLGKPTGGTPVVLMGRMPMLRFHARANIAASADHAESRRAGIACQWAWTLDPVGNWSGYKASGATTQPWDLDQARLHNKANEIEDTVNQTPNAISGTPDWVDPAYDTAGNMTAGPQPRYETADANTQLYKYDAWNRLTKIYRDANCNDTIDDPSELVVTYSYDGLNRRIRKVVAGDDTYDYYYNESWQMLEVRKGGDTDPLEQYVWGIQYVDAPVVRFRDGNVDGDLDDTQDNTDSTLYYTYDGNFNVTALIGTNGTVAERYTYDPYGKVTFKAADWSDAASQTKSAYDNEILYCGYRFDPESGNYIVRLRYLTPPLGRWLTTDPIVHGDGMNWYQYVGGMPTIALDPQGTIFVILTGLNFLGGGGKSDDLDGASQAIQIKLAPQLMQYQAEVTGPITFVVFSVAKKAGGGPGGPGFIRDEYTKFVKRKNADICSLEQFIVIGHSDGATAIRIASPDINDVKWPPAYYGLVDLVRLDLWLPLPNTDSQATTDIKASSETYVHNFRQIQDSWKGHFVTGAHNVDPFNDVGHMGIPRDARVKAQMGEKATEAYIERVKKDIQGGRPSRWVFRGMFNVSW